MICNDCKHRYWTPNMKTDDLKCALDTELIIHRTKSKCLKYKKGKALYWKKSIIELEKEKWEQKLKKEVSQ